MANWSCPIGRASVSPSTRPQSTGLRRDRLTMLGHVSFGVEKLTRAGEFYDRVLAPLGYVRVWANDRGIGFGEEGGGDKLALFARPGQASAPGAGFHLAFMAPSRGAVDAFHAAA